MIAHKLLQVFHVHVAENAGVAAGTPVDRDTALAGSRMLQTQQMPSSNDKPQQILEDMTI